MYVHSIKRGLLQFIYGFFNTVIQEGGGLMLLNCYIASEKINFF